MAKKKMAKKSTSMKATKTKIATAKTEVARTKGDTMTLQETLRQLESLGNEKVRAHNSKNGAGHNQFGVKHGDIRLLANKIKTNHELALSLWKTGNIDAQYLAVLLMMPSRLTRDEMDRLVRST